MALRLNDMLGISRSPIAQVKVHAVHTMRASDFCGSVLVDAAQFGSEPDDRLPPGQVGSPVSNPQTVGNVTVQGDLEPLFHRGEFVVVTNMAVVGAASKEDV